VRILHLTWEYPPIVHGGLGRHVDALSRAQARAGHDVSVLAPSDDVTGRCRTRPEQHEVVEGVEVLRVPLEVTGPVDAAALPAVMQRMQRAMLAAAADPTARSLAPDVVHGHDWMVADAARALADAAGRPFVLTVHATELGRRFGRLDEPLHVAVHEAECRAVTAADHVVVCSAAMADEVVRHHGARPERLSVVPGAVEARRWQVAAASRATARRRWAADVDHLVVAAGRLEWEKGFSTLIRAMPALLARHPSSRVVLVGSGSYEPVLRRLAAGLGLQSSVRLPGRLPTPDLAALFAGADAVVVPSRYEPFGLVALEAQAAGAPLVVTRVGGLAQSVTDGRTGRVVEPSDVDGLAQVLGELLADPAAARRVAAAGRRAAAARTWAATARLTTAVYRQATRHSR
jgi:glycogen synthase